AVAVLQFSQNGDWCKVIADETDKDAKKIVLAGRVVSLKDARESARKVAGALVMTKAKALEMHALGDIQTWRDVDEQKVDAVRRVLTTAGDLPDDGPSRIYAAHVVAGAVMEALANGADIPVIFDRRVKALAKRQAQTPVGGPLFARHPANTRRDVAYLRHPRMAAEKDPAAKTPKPARGGGLNAGRGRDSSP